jgi:hypothetical protein
MSAMMSGSISSQYIGGKMSPPIGSSINQTPNHGIPHPGMLEQGEGAKMQYMHPS